MPIARRPSTGPREGAPRPAPGTYAKRRHVLAVPYEHRGVAQDAGASWSAAAKAYVYEGDALPGSLDAYRAQDYSWERMQEDLLNDAPLVEARPTRTVVPHAHQDACVETHASALRAGRTTFLNADDVGLGKTIETWLSILRNLPDAETVLVVCPLSAVANWRRTIQWLGDGGKRVVVINYDRLKTLFEVPESVAAKSRGGKGRKRGKVRTMKGVARYGEPLGFDVAVWDESHRLRNLASARSKLAIRLYEACDHLIWLSATAGQTPLELGYLFPFLMEATGARKSALLDWEKWCEEFGIGVKRAAFGRWVWDAEGPTADDDLRKVHGLLFGGSTVAGIRRTPGEIVGWPEKNRVLLPVSMEGEDRVNYGLAWAEFRRTLELKASGKIDKGGGLVAALRFRQKSSLLRTASTLDLVEELLAQGLQVAVSVAFVETLEVLRDALVAGGHAVALYYGGQGGARNEAARLDFQNGRSRVCVYTVTEAISLHEGELVARDAKRANVLHDLRWSGIDCHQIEGRTHRDGRFSQAYWMVGENTVEEGIATVVLGRMRSMGLMQGDEGTVEAIEAMLLKAA